MSVVCYSLEGLLSVRIKLGQYPLYTVSEDSLLLYTLPTPVVVTRDKVVFGYVPCTFNHLSVNERSGTPLTNPLANYAMRCLRNANSISLNPLETCSTHVKRGKIYGHTFQKCNDITPQQPVHVWSARDTAFVQFVDPCTNTFVVANPHTPLHGCLSKIDCL